MAKKITIILIGLLVIFIVNPMIEARADSLAGSAERSALDYRADVLGIREIEIPINHKPELNTSVNSRGTTVSSINIGGIGGTGSGDTGGGDNTGGGSGSGSGGEGNTGGSGGSDGVGGNKFSGEDFIGGDGLGGGGSGGGSGSGGSGGGYTGGGGSGGYTGGGGSGGYVTTTLVNDVDTIGGDKQPDGTTGGTLMDPLPKRPAN